MMRLIQHLLVVSVLVVETSSSTRYDHGSHEKGVVQSRGHLTTRAGMGRSRALKKGKDQYDDDNNDSEGDYYYGGSDRHSMHDNNKNNKKETFAVGGDDGGNTVPSTSPPFPFSLAPFGKDDQNIPPPTHAPESSMPPPKKKIPDKKMGMDKNSKKLNSGKGKGKGKGKGGGDMTVDDDFVYDDDDYDESGSMGPCSSHVALQLQNAIPEIITRNPISCCYSSEKEMIAIYVTHALPSKYTNSGLELFWDQIYEEIVRTSRAQQVCFVFTGLSHLPNSNNDNNDRSIEQILFDTISLASELPNVGAIMTTDPTTENTNLVDEVRRIYNNNTLPNIGLFNAGYNNIIIESIIQNNGRLPYIGYIDDAEYGRMAAEITIELWNNTNNIVTQPIVPLCFNARIGIIDYLGDRCTAYYNTLSSTTIEPIVGVPCRSDSTLEELLVLLNDTSRGDINAVYAPLECCSVITSAVETFIQMSSTTTTTTMEPKRRIIVGCQDDDPTNGFIDFITAQPIALQGYMTASFANFPIIQQQQQYHENNKKRTQKKSQFFPSLQTFVHTSIFNKVISS